ncbi:MAG: SUMF1/EgtB/PvdO family nonheme iron enzyme, partial [Verrucomicrobiales bacterium]
PGKDGVWLCRIETRVRDFRAFSLATDYVQTGGAYVLKVNQTAEGGYTTAWELDDGASWEKPGFMQAEDHPVVCVNWEDARAMAAWLSRKEPGLAYRLPSDEEWSAAVGASGRYPWGDAWPGPEGAGNYAGIEWSRNLPGGQWPTAYSHDDGAERTAPVASFTENRFGFFDLGGNVWEWCEDQYKNSMNDADAIEAIPALRSEKADDRTLFRVVRGSSWSDRTELNIRSSCRNLGHPSGRYAGRGFRFVVSVDGGG